ncbi:methyl-accepting chemotaxis protein [Ruminococcus sp.]|uniref:methyl-accepting chemotaxis protein n=1 Tax=Ruminococcus sp. TaxID=41978 RepID=UPI0025E4AE29|nr:methyl-accepting chemotaxis protein [Ruminococcus sp.]
MKTLRSKLLIAMLAIALVITCLLGGVSVYFINSSARDTLKSTVEPLAVQAAKNFDSTITTYVGNLTATTQSEPFKSADNDKERLMLMKQNFSDNAGSYLNFTLFDADGIVIDSDSRSIASSVEIKHVKSAAEQSSAYITSLYNFNSTVYFTILASGENEKGEKLVGAVTIDATMLSVLLNEYAFGQSGYVYLIDQQGDVLIHKDMDKVIDGENVIKIGDSDSDYKEFSDTVTKLVKNDSGTTEYNIKGEEYIVGYYTSQYFDGTVIMVTDVADFTSASTKALTNIIILGVVLMALTVLFSLIFAKRITKPIISTTNRLRSLAQGNLTDPVDVWYSKDELGVLSNSLEETIVCLRQYINLITVALTQISEGNLCHRMEGTFKGDFYKIKSTFNEILDSLSDTFASINLSAEQVNSGAVQVSNIAQSVSQGSTQQASAIEQLSATLNDVSKQITQNSADAKNAYNIVSQNTEAVDNCNTDMSKMLNAMNAINTASSEISKIIKVIDEIAFQTNILALNAAVEAAREGSKGFGVVADEVRRLASRSAEAAKQTASLIENQAAAVSKGSQIAEETADSLNEIVEKSNTIKDLVKNISEASEAQTEAIVQVNTGVDQISAVVSANTSTAVGSASASEELSSQSLILKNMIARFKLSDESERKENSQTSRYSYIDDEPEEGAVPSTVSTTDVDEEVSDDKFTNFDENDKY